MLVVEIGGEGAEDKEEEEAEEGRGRVALELPTVS
jgi:hypothetical protein